MGEASQIEGTTGPTPPGVTLPPPPKVARGHVAQGTNDRARIVVNVKSKTFAQIADLAEADGCTVSEMVRRLIAKALAGMAREGRTPGREG